MHTVPEAIETGGRRPGLWAWAMLAPLLGWLLLFVVLPAAIMVVFSVGRRDAIGQVVLGFTGENYARILGGVSVGPLLLCTALAVNATVAHAVFFRGGRTMVFAAVLWASVNVVVFGATRDSGDGRWLKLAVVSVNYAAASTAICVLLAYPVAFFIGRASDRWRNLLVMLVTIPFWTSFLVRTYAWVAILREEGLLNTVLQGLHLIARPLDLYPSMTGVMIGLVYTYLPFMVLPIYASVERLDRSLIEAALDLGATPARAFARVILPLTRPGVVAGVVLTFVPAIGMFAVNDILGGRRGDLIGNVIERQFTAARDKPFGAALGIMLLLLFVATYALTLRRRDADAPAAV